jgi:hypothetical protein
VERARLLDPGGRRRRLAALGVHEVFEFRLQTPANALPFCTLASVAVMPAAPALRRRGPQDRVIRSPLAKGNTLAHCPKCKSRDLRRSWTRSRWEPWRRAITDRRASRCRACHWRGWMPMSSADIAPPSHVAPSSRRSAQPSWNVLRARQSTSSARQQRARPVPRRGTGPYVVNHAPANRM